MINLTAQEMSLNYTSNKNILIEAKESCRVPVPVERCPLDRIMNETQNSNQISEAPSKKCFIVILNLILFINFFCSEYFKWSWK